MVDQRVPKEPQFIKALVDASIWEGGNTKAFGKNHVEVLQESTVPKRITFERAADLAVRTLRDVQRGNFKR